MSRTRLDVVLEKIRDILGGFLREIRVLAHYVVNDKEYLKIRIELETGFIEIREYLTSGYVKNYAYYFEYQNKRVWWNNKPHHKEVTTYPHHKHEDGIVKPLEKHDLEDFLGYVRKYVKTPTREKRNKAQREKSA